MNTDKNTQTDILIIGSGPAGYTAAIYAARANRSPIVIEGLQPGGQLTETTSIENFPGYPEGVGGFEMMDDLRKQAERYGADIRSGLVSEIDLSQRPFVATVDSEYTITAKSVIIATGASAKMLGLPEEKKYMGAGVSACATCDGFFYRGKTVAVVGGGDTACGDAIYLSSLAKKVYLIVRRDELRASQVMQDRVLETENIEVLWKHQAEGLFGEPTVQGAKLVVNKGEADERHTEIAIDGFFEAIGHKPNTDFLNSQLKLDEHGFILTKDSGDPATEIEGVYAAGDVADSVYRQAVSAAGIGCRAAIAADRFLKMRGE